MNNMKKKLVLFASVAIALASCQTTPKEDYSWIKKGLDVASAQLQLTAEEIEHAKCIIVASDRQVEMARFLPRITVVRIRTDRK